VPPSPNPSSRVNRSDIGALACSRACPRAAPLKSVTKKPAASVFVASTFVDARVAQLFRLETKEPFRMV
jgi:hypothetical protein